MADSYVGYAPANRISLANGSVTVGALATTGTASSSTYLRGDMAWSTNPLGDVTGPGSSTDDALAKYDSTTGKLLQNSNATLTDAGLLTVANVAATINTAAQPNITSLGTIASLVATTADIDGGTVDGAIIGGASAAAGTFTTVTGNTSVTTAQVDITAQGDLRLQDTTGGQYVGFQAPGTVSSTYTITMPAAVATTTGQALTSTTGGVASWTDVGDALLAGDQTWTGSQRGTLVTDNDGSFDQDGGNNFFCTPSGNITLTFTNHTSGQSGYILFDNAGAHTVSLHANTKGDANLASTLSTAGTYLVSYLDNGTNAYLTTSAVFA